ncbi:ribonuclease H-like domain-containing protein [Tanacetum coccineum]
MENSKRGTIPMQEKLKLSKSQGASTPAEIRRMQNIPYASAVGSIVVMVVEYWNRLRFLATQICGYLTDADDMKSQTGYVFVLNGGAVDWKSTKKSIFATSSYICGIMEPHGTPKKFEFSNVTKARYEEQQELEGFMGGLNGEQFPSIKDMDGMPSSPSLEKDTDSDWIKEGMSTRDKDDCVTKIAKTNENQGSSSKASNSGKENPWNLCKTGDGKSLVDIVNASKLDNKLVEIPTIVNENGNEVVIFDDELIDLDEEGIKEVINNGPWMVNNKPMFVQKWCIDMCLDKTEPQKLPVWVKMLKVPMKAWSVKGISALASCLGKPIIIDEVTTRMCVTSVGRIRFARVLIEIDAGKEIKDRIEVMYKGKNVAVGTKKFVDVEYAWKPSACAHCKVFGHEETKCRIKNKSEQSTNVEQASGNEFKTVHNKKVRNAGHDQGQKRMEEATNVKETNVGDNIEKEDNNIQNKTNTKESKNGNNNLKEDELSGLSKSNRFTLLNELVDEEELVPIVNKREVVDKFFKNRINPTEKDMENWNSPIVRIYVFLRSITTDTSDKLRFCLPRTQKDSSRERERKARTTLLMALPEDHLAKFHKMTDAKEMWDAIKSRFGGNDESKKMQKYILNLQLKIQGAGVSTEDTNQKFLRSLPSAWSQVSLIMRTKPGVDSLSFDDLYNNLRVFESDIKGSTASSSSSPQNVAFVSENTSSTNEVSTAYCVPNLSGQNTKYEQTSSYSLLANQSIYAQLIKRTWNR